MNIVALIAVSLSAALVGFLLGTAYGRWAEDREKRWICQAIERYYVDQVRRTLRYYEQRRQKPELDGQAFQLYSNN